MLETTISRLCNICHASLIEPFILCAECKFVNALKPIYSFHICLKCFSTGAETGNHSNSHKYIIIHDKIRVFPNTIWTAREDCRLLELVERCGFANWLDIGRAMGTFSAEECRDHYIENYFNGIFSKACKLTNSPYNRIETPYLFRSNSFDPPRNKLDEMHNRFIANYRFARSEFDSSFDGSAERIITGLHMTNEWNTDFQCISDSLNLALVRAYNNRLR